MPSNKLEDIHGLGSIYTWLCHKVYNKISHIFKFEHRKAYWLRYNPKSEPAYLILCNSRIGLREVRALMKVLQTSVFEFKK